MRVTKKVLKTNKGVDVDRLLVGLNVFFAGVCFTFDMDLLAWFNVAVAVFASLGEVTSAIRDSRKSGQNAGDCTSPRIRSAEREG